MKKLFLDYEKYNESKDFKTDCDYFYHPDNKGVKSLIELAAFSLVCRKCEEAPCVSACPKDALEKQKNGMVKRYNMRCVGCKSCVIACPFGAICSELIDFYAHKCDYCLKGLNGEAPVCVKTATDKEVLQYINISENKEKHIHSVGENLVVHAIPWRKKPKKKK